MVTHSMVAVYGFWVCGFFILVILTKDCCFLILELLFSVCKQFLQFCDFSGFLFFIHKLNSVVLDFRSPLVIVFDSQFISSILLLSLLNRLILVAKQPFLIQGRCLQVDICWVESVDVF